MWPRPSVHAVRYHTFRVKKTNPTQSKNADPRRDRRSRDTLILHSELGEGLGVISGEGLGAGLGVTSGEGLGAGLGVISGEGLGAGLGTISGEGFTIGSGDGVLQASRQASYAFLHSARLGPWSSVCIDCVLSCKPSRIHLAASPERHRAGENATTVASPKAKMKTARKLILLFTLIPSLIGLTCPRANNQSV